MGRKQIHFEPKTHTMDHFLFTSPGGLSSVDEIGLGTSYEKLDLRIDQAAQSSRKIHGRSRKQMNKSVSFADEVKESSEGSSDGDIYGAWKSSHDIHTLSACNILSSGESSPKSVYYQFDVNENDNIRGDRLETQQMFTPESNKGRKEIPQQSPTSTSAFEFSSSSSKSSSTCLSLELNVDSDGFIMMHGYSKTEDDFINVPLSETSMNTAEEISECVADILEQTMTSSTLARDDSSAVDTDSKTSISMTTTNEIEECVADIMDQTMATDRLMTRLCYIKNQKLPSRVSSNLSQIAEEVTEKPIAPKSIAFKTKTLKISNDAASASQMDSTPLSSEILREEEEERDRRLNLINRRTRNNTESRFPSKDYLSSDSDSGSSQSTPALAESVTSTSWKQHTPDSGADNFTNNNTRSVCSSTSSDLNDEIQQLNTNATELLARNDFDGALQAFESVIDLCTQSMGEIHPIVSSTKHNIGIVYCKRASLSDDPQDTDNYNRLSIDSFKKASDIARATLGHNHPNVAVSMVRVGLIQLQIGNFEEANRAFHESLNIRRLSLGDDHPLVAKVYNNIGVANLHAERMQGALDAFECASRLQRKILSKAYESKQNISESEMELADTLCNIGSLCLDWLEKDEAYSENAELAEKAHSVLSEALGFRYKLCEKSDEKVQQAICLVEEAKSFIDRFGQESKKDDASSTSTYATACEVVVSCPSDEKLCKSESDNEFKLSDDGSSGSLKLSRIYVKDRVAFGFEVAPIDISAIPDFHESYLSESKSNLSNQEFNSSNQVTPSQIRKLSQTVQSLSYGSPSDGRKSPSSSKAQKNRSSNTTATPVKEAFDENHSRSDDFVTSDLDLNPVSSGSFDHAVLYEINEAEFAKYPHKYSFQIHDFASMCLKNGHLDKSLSWFNFLLDYYRSEHGELHRDIGATLHNIGLVLMRLERYEEALLSFQRAVRVRRGAIGRDHADVATSLVKVGVVETFLGRFDSALFTFREALSVRRHALGHLHPSTARIYNNIGCAHLQFNEMKEARCAFESALDVQRNALLYDPNNIQLQHAISLTLLNLAHLYTSRAMNEKACLVLSEALGFQENIYGSDSPYVMSTLDSLANCHVASGDNIKALSCYGSILERLKGKGIKKGKFSHRKERTIGLLLYKISQLHKKQNDLEATMKYLEKSVTHLQKIGPSDLLSKVNSEVIVTKKRLEDVNYEWV